MKVHLTEVVENVVKRSATRLTSQPLSPSLRKWQIDHSGNCSSPVTVELFGRPERVDTKTLVLPVEGKPMWAIMEVRCRQCPECLKARAAHWRMRILSEASSSARTWLCTLTVNPDERVKCLSRLRVRLAKQGLDFDALPPDEQWREIHSELSRDVTTYLKRVRKNSGAVLRFIAVAESHKSGYPHFHMLIHQKWPDQPVLWRHLDTWKLGFAKYNLVDQSDKSALTYCAKYLSKSIAARVRASLRYGDASISDTNNDHALTSIDDYKNHRETPLTPKSPPITPEGSNWTEQGEKENEEFSTLSRIKRASEMVARADTEAKTRSRRSC